MINHPIRTSTRPYFHWLRNESGSTTIEFVIWLPIMIFVLIMSAQGAMFFMVQANYGHAARDTARLVARHALTPEEAESRLLSGSLFASSKASASVDISGGVVMVSISTKASDISSFDVFGLVDNLEIAARITHEMEPM